MIDTQALISGGKALRMGYGPKNLPDPDEVISPPWTRRDVEDMRHVSRSLAWLAGEMKSGCPLTPARHGRTIRDITEIQNALAAKERDFLRKAGFSPAQPRVPAGHADGGEWTGGGGGAGSEGHGPSADRQVPLPARRPYISGQPRRLRSYPSSANSSPVKRVDVDKDRNVTLHHEDGSTEKRIGGSPAWRNNNPGNLRPSDFSDRHGAVGSNNGMAVFPDAATGHEAARALLKGPTYSGLTIDEAITRRSPSNENDTEKLKRDISKRAGLNGNRKIKDLDPEEVDSLLEAIYLFEGWKEGAVTKTSATRTKTFSAF